jgi:hypothetical protein
LYSRSVVVPRRRAAGHRRPGGVRRPPGRLARRPDLTVVLVVTVVAVVVVGALLYVHVGALRWGLVNVERMGARSGMIRKRSFARELEGLGAARGNRSREGDLHTVLRRRRRRHRHRRVRGGLSLWLHATVAVLLLAAALIAAVLIFVHMPSRPGNG